MAYLFLLSDTARCSFHKTLFLWKVLLTASRHNFYFYQNKFLKRFTYFLIAIACGLLLFAAWPVSPLTLLIFVAWVPLLWLESKVKSRKKFFGLTYIAMFIWNVCTTWWIWNASEPGALAAFFANSFIMCLPWLGYTTAKKWLGETIGYISLIAFWMCFEYIHQLDWGLSWPWLILGNAFATRPEWIQWYEYTGTSGGSLWVLLSNLLVFALINEYNNRGRTKKYFLLIASWVFLLLIPSTLVGLFIKKDQPPAATTNIVVVQPNIDPYEKVSTGSFEAQLEKLIVTTEKTMDDYTGLVVWPETALYMANGISETEMKQNYFLNPLWSFLKRHPHISLFTGMESYRVFDKPTKTSQDFNGFHVESYNGSVLLDSSGPQSFYHKSMLVPGVETLPWFLKFLGKWFDKFGGTTAGYSRQNERTVLEEKHGYRIAPAICYESIYGDFMRRYIKKGANLICVVTNDGWWKKTPGHKQHMNYARLRAIETRTWVARSANTGISCFINPYGKVINPQPYDTQAAIKMFITTENKRTFFVKYGDMLSKIMTGLAVLLLFWMIYLKTLKRFFKKSFPTLPD
jgi:apolipoprotein N-acyltransferase